MRKIYIDYETRSVENLKTAGAWKYSCDPSTKVLVMAYAIDDGPVKIWIPGESEFPFKKFTKNDIFIAHNAYFENCISRNVLGVEIPVSQWYCTASISRANGVPGKLEFAGKVLDLDVKKDEVGRAVMLKLCKPRKPRKGEDPNGVYFYNDKKDFLRLYQYCTIDVEVSRTIFNTLPPLPETERALWELDQEINLFGIHVDRKAILKFQEAIAVSRRIAEAKLRRLTKGKLTNTRQRDLVLEYLQDETGLDISSLQKKEIEDLLRGKISTKARAILEHRKEYGKTSTAKLISFLNRIDSDDYVRDILIYHGAHTGRWTSAGLQLHNFPRPEDAEVNSKIDFVRNASITDILASYPDIVSLSANALRGLIVPSKGNSLFVADYSAIEARVLFWIAGDEHALNIYRTGGDIYKDMASFIYGVRIEDVTKDQRQMGKRVILGAGYGMGHDKFVKTCASEGVIISPDNAKTAINGYRTKYERVRALWKSVENTAIQAVRNPGKKYTMSSGISFAMAKDGKYLRIRLPSGRTLKYWNAHIKMEKTPWDTIAPKLYYTYENKLTKKIETGATYGGALVENIVQAIARDLMAEAKLRVRKYGFRVLLSVHDEIVSEAKENKKFSLAKYIEIMTELPEWGEGCPVTAEGSVMKRFGK